MSVETELLRASQPPLPLGMGDALAQAMRLREQHGMTYETIAHVASVYHGVHRTGRWWRNQLRLRGAPAKHYANGTRRTFPRVP